MSDKKRLFEEISKADPTIWSNSSAEEIIQLQHDLENFMGKKLAESDVSRAEKCISEMQEKLDTLEFGGCDSWGNECWAEPIVKVKFPVDIILRIANVDKRWELALELANKMNIFLLEMISSSFETDSAFQEIVCEKLSAVIVDLWQKIEGSDELPKNCEDLVYQFSLYDVDGSGSNRSSVLEDCNVGNAKKALVHVNEAKKHIKNAIDRVGNLEDIVLK